MEKEEAKQLVLGFLNDTQNDDVLRMIPGEAARIIINDEEIMEIIEQHHNGWMIIFEGCLFEIPRELIGQKALSRTKNFNEAAAFLHCKPEKISKEALIVMEKFASGNKEYVFLAKNHHDEQKIRWALSKGIETATMVRECLGVIEAAEKASMSLDPNIIGQIIHKAAMISEDRSDLKLLYNFTIAEINEERLSYGSNARKIRSSLLRSIAQDSKVPFFGKKTIIDLLKINTLRSEWEASKLLEASMIIEGIRSDTQQNPGCPEQLIIEKLCQNS